MRESIGVELHITNVDGARGTGVLEVERLSLTTKLRRAAVRFFALFFAGIISIAIPLAHFCLPALLPILGVVWAISSWRASVLVVAGATHAVPSVRRERAC